MEHCPIKVTDDPDVVVYCCDDTSVYKRGQDFISVYEGISEHCQVGPKGELQVIIENAEVKWWQIVMWIACVLITLMSLIGFVRCVVRKCRKVRGRPEAAEEQAEIQN